MKASRKPRNPNSDRNPVLLICGKSKTKQSHKKECDIHTILKQYDRTGLLTHVSKKPPMFIDLANVPDYRSALNNVNEAETLFYQLPSATRAEFENDPGLFLDFCVDPENEDKLRELGLLPPSGDVAVVSSPGGEPVVVPATGSGEGQGPEGAASGSPDGDLEA